MRVDSTENVEEIWATATFILDMDIKMGRGGSGTEVAVLLSAAWKKGTVNNVNTEDQFTFEAEWG